MNNITIRKSWFQQKENLNTFKQNGLLDLPENRRLREGPSVNSLSVDKVILCNVVVTLEGYFGPEGRDIQLSLNSLQWRSYGFY